MIRGVIWVPEKGGVLSLLSIFQITWNMKYINITQSQYITIIIHLPTSSVLLSASESGPISLEISLDSCETKHGGSSSSGPDPPVLVSSHPIHTSTTFPPALCPPTSSLSRNASSRVPAHLSIHLSAAQWSGQPPSEEALVFHQWCWTSSGTGAHKNLYGMFATLRANRGLVIWAQDLAFTPRKECNYYDFNTTIWQRVES